MELRQLEYFVAVAEEANFTRAAERVHITQSGVSAQIRQLERELGAELFDRSGKRATLTPAGKAALEPARAALAAAGAVGQAVDEIHQLVRGRLRVGMVTACTVAPLFDALASFHRAHAGVELALAEGNSDRLVDQVRAGDLDLALVGTAVEPPPDLEALPIVREGLVALVPPGHILAGRSRVTLRALRDHTIIGLPVGTGIRAAFDQACAQRGVVLPVHLEATAPDAVMDLAARGLGVAVLSASMAEGRPLVARPITDARVPATLSLVWRRSGASHALRELVGHCRVAFGGVPAP